MIDDINKASHYNQHPSGVEVIEIVQHECFCIGNALKYILRHKHKGNAVKDLQKAIYYLERKIELLENG